MTLHILIWNSALCGMINSNFVLWKSRTWWTVDQATAAKFMEVLFKPSRTSPPPGCPAPSTTCTVRLPGQHQFYLLQLVQTSGPNSHHAWIVVTGDGEGRGRHDAFLPLLTHNRKNVYLFPRCIVTYSKRLLVLVLLFGNWKCFDWILKLYKGQGMFSDQLLFIFS